MKKAVVGKPLTQLQPFIGEWKLEGRHVAFPSLVIHGRATFAWSQGGAFVEERWTMEHPDFPDSISIIGATGPNGNLAVHYYDTRGVHRVYDMTFNGGVWTLDRKGGPGDFDQRATATFSADGKTIAAEFELRELNAKDYKHDMDLTYKRVTKGKSRARRSKTKSRTRRR